MRGILFIALILINVELSLAEDKSVKIGAILHLTGEFAIQGEAFRQGVELAAEEVNRSGGANGKKLEILYEDTQYKPLNSNTAAKKLAADKSVIGTLISTLTEAKAAVAVLEKEKLPSIVLWDSSPELDKIGDYIFSIGPWAPASGEKSADFAFKKLNAKSAVIISVQTEWSVYVSEYFAKRFREIGGRVASSLSVDPNERDFKTFLLKAKSYKPDVIYAPIDSNILPFFKQYKDYNIKIPLITSDILDKELFDAGGDIFEGVYQSQSSNPDFPATAKLISAYQKKYSRNPDYLMYTSWGYDGVMLLVKAMATSEISKSSLKDELYNISEHEGASGTISFSKNGSAPREVKLYVVNGTKLTAVE